MITNFDVVCVSPAINLTKYKIYNVSATTSDRYRVEVDDNGESNIFYSYRFMTLEEFRDHQINKII